MTPRGAVAAGHADAAVLGAGGAALGGLTGAVAAEAAAAAVRRAARAVLTAVAGAVAAGLAVVRVEPERDDLEHIFLEVTRGELQ